MPKLIVGLNDLATEFPEVAAESYGWDPSNHASRSHKRLTWRCKHGHIWEASVANRTVGKSGCPYCSGLRAITGVNDLATLYPEIAVEADGWNPQVVKPKASKKLPWRCAKGHSWEARVADRTPPSNTGCPYCTGRLAHQGFNDLLTLFPQLAKEADGWDPLTVTVGCRKKLPWKCTHGHRWKAEVNSRTPPQGRGCPICSGKKVLAGFNDLASSFPELAKEANGWDPTKVTCGSNKKLLWICTYGHTWKAQVNSRTPPHNRGCPVCTGRVVLPGFNDLETLYPNLAQEVIQGDPRAVTRKSSKVFTWRCKEGHTWKASVLNRTPPASSGCPFCAESGFKMELQAWFYLLERPGEQQIGITNHIEDRLYTHSLAGWSEIEVVGPYPGDLVFATEKALKQWLRKEIGLVPGTHENWYTASLEVRSLAELRRKSLVETTLF